MKRLAGIALIIIALSSGGIGIAMLGGGLAVPAFLVFAFGVYFLVTSFNKEENNKNKTVDFKDTLGKDDEGKRLLISMPQSIGDVYLCTALLKNIKETYPDYNIYFATKPEYFEVVEGNPYIYKTILL